MKNLIKDACMVELQISKKKKKEWVCHHMNAYTNAVQSL